MEAQDGDTARKVRAERARSGKNRTKKQPRFYSEFLDFELLATASRGLYCVNLPMNTRPQVLR
jgi:hypothetical protein